MQTKTTKIIIAIIAAVIISACKEGRDFYQPSAVNARYRSDQQVPPSTTSGFFMGDAPKTGRGAMGAPPSTTATTSDAPVPASEPLPASVPAGEAPPSTTAAPASAPAPAAASAEAPPSTTASPPAN